MKCPACFNDLKTVQCGGVTVDICHGGCGGVWFDAFELQQVDEQEERAGYWLVDVERDPHLQVDFQRKRDCPRCSDVKLKRRYFSPRREVEIDECPGCGGCWLDAGELQRIREETGLDKMRAQIRKPYLNCAVLRYLYELRIESSIGLSDPPESDSTRSGD